ncbi:MAG: aminoacyltransferase, partial [Bacilli bacterium]|nr:aminoacyltransferase [Bacilli bacterium]
MKFTILDEKEFASVQNTMPYSSFYQTTAWAQIKAKNGWECFYVGIKNENSVIAASLLLAKKLFLNKKMFYAPRGLLLDYSNVELLTFFTNKLKSFITSHGGILLKIDPLVEYKHRDMDGKIMDDGFDNEKIYQKLLDLGYKHEGFTVGYSKEAQFRWSYGLDITPSKDEILKGMNQRCRRCLKKANKYSLTRVDVTKDNIQDFKAIMEHTAVRQNHFDRSVSYYLDLLEILKDRIKMSIIYLDKQKFLKDFPDDKLVELIKKEKEDMIPISAGVFIFDADRANYVYGGTYSHYMPLMAQYKMQMDMIEIAQEKKLPLYDFGGISGDFTPGTPNYGVYEFKKGFGGFVIEYIGEFNLVIHPFYSGLYNTMYGT